MADRQFHFPGFGRTGFRLSLQYSVLYSSLVAVVFLVAFFYSQFEIRDWAYDWMEDDAAKFEQIFDERGKDQLIIAIDTLTIVNFERTRIYGVFDLSGVKLAGNFGDHYPPITSGFLDLESLGLPPDPEGEISGYWIRADEIAGVMVFQGASDSLIFELLEPLAVTLAFGFAALIGLGFLFGSRVGRITERRVERISSALDLAAKGEQAVKVSTDPHRHDDLGYVEAKIDDALSKIENLVAVQRQISVDIAHDLRSPLQRLRQRIERLRKSDQFETEKSLALEAIEEIEQTFNALLTIAELEHGNVGLETTAVPVKQLFHDLEDLYADNTSEAGQDLAFTLVDEELTLKANRSLLLQLLGNLVENALKHCPSGTHITVEAKRDGSTANLVVRDDGPGVSDDFLDRAFDRFTREEPSRHVAGNGLGLSLVRAIAQCHGARVELKARRPGLSVAVLGIPLS